MVVEGALSNGSLAWRLPLIDPLVCSDVADPLRVHLRQAEEEEVVGGEVGEEVEGEKVTSTQTWTLVQ